MCIAVLGVVMAVAYVSTTHSLQVGTDAGNRNRALGFAQQQIEQIKYLQQNNTLTTQLAANNVAVNQHFCFDPSTSSFLALGGGNSQCTICTTSNSSVDKYINGGSCPANDDSIYSMYMTYDASNIFTAIASWVAPNGSGFDNLTLYYKAPS